MNYNNCKKNRVIELYIGPRGYPGDPLRNHDLTLEGFLILDDDWLCKDDKNLHCIETNTDHEVLEFKVYSRTESTGNYISGGIGIPGSPIKREYACVKLTNQDIIQVGYEITRTQTGRFPQRLKP